MRLDAIDIRGFASSLRSERGFALPTVIIALVASFGLASAAVVAAVTAQGGSVRDQNTKAALGAAEAGAENAILRFNRTATEGLPDICQFVGGGQIRADGWCEQPITGAFDRGGYSAWIRPSETELQIVSTGSVDGVTRRIILAAPSDSGQTQGITPFEDADVVGLDGIHLDSNAKIFGDLATNGNIGMDANSQIVCDYAGVGPGKGINPNNGGQINCTPSEGEVSLPPVNPGDVMTNNSNDRICTLDPCHPNPTRVTWDPEAKKLEFRATGWITLGAAGGVYNYAFCQVHLRSNSYLQVASGATVRLYFGSPEECDGQTEPLKLDSGSKIQPTGSDPADLAILIVGSEDTSTYVELNSNAILFDCDQSFILYAPLTEVTLNSNVHICGGVAAKKIHVESNSSITASNSATDFELPNTEEHASFGYGPPSFIECSATPPSAEEPPDANC